MMEKDQVSVDKMSAYFISTTVFERLEKNLFESIGFKRYDGRVGYVIDILP